MLATREQHVRATLYQHKRTELKMTDNFHSDDQTVARGEGPSDQPGSEGGPTDSKRSWRLVALVTAGAALTIGGTVVVTLAATHKTAVHENLQAYLNGVSDTHRALEMGMDPFEA